MKLTEMKALLEQERITLTKSLGQNFLHDGNQLRRIVESAELSPQDNVLEVGPGLGPLTGRLLEGAGQVLAIEKDARLVHVLQARFARELAAESGSAKLTLIHEDALDYLKREEKDWSGWKLVANLPYSVASPILVELGIARHGPERMVATLQLEVVQRIIATAGDEDYGLLTILLQGNYEAHGWFKIPPGCFFPPPDVDSACVCLIRRRKPLLPPQKFPTYVRVVKRSFSQRRKMMFKLLKTDWPEAQLESAFADLEIPRQARAESIEAETFAKLAERLHE
jgi:16S rRNA (adenine1518-N6/adenine1519-N6)-dimethyltransferase